MIKHILVLIATLSCFSPVFAQDDKCELQPNFKLSDAPANKEFKAIVCWAESFEIRIEAPNPETAEKSKVTVTSSDAVTVEPIKPAGSKRVFQFTGITKQIESVEATLKIDDTEYKLILTLKEKAQTSNKTAFTPSGNSPYIPTSLQFKDYSKKDSCVGGSSCAPYQPRPVHHITYNPCCISCNDKSKLMFANSSFMVIPRKIHGNLNFTPEEIEGFTKDTSSLSTKIDDLSGELESLNKDILTRKEFKHRWDSLEVEIRKLKKDSVKTISNLAKVNKWYAVKNLYNMRKFRLHVGLPFTMDVININPYKYNVIIEIRDTNYNEETAMIFDEMLSKYIESAKTLVSGNDEITRMRDSVLQMAYDLNKYTDMMKLQDCVDYAQFKKDRDAIVSHIDNKFSTDFKALLLSDDVIQGIVRELGKDADTLVIQALHTYYTFANMSFQYTYGIPQVPNKDEVILHINIHPKDSSETGYHFKGPIHLPVKGGFKIDGSLGFFYSNLSSHSYYMENDSFMTMTNNGQDTTWNSGSRIYSGGKNTGEYGAMAFIHFYPRLSRGFNIAGTMGIGVTLEGTPKPRGMAGVSLLFGKENRLALTGGAVFGFVDRLASRYQEPRLYGSTSNITTSVLRVNAFAGISYNFGFATHKNASVGSGEKKKNSTSKEGNSGTAGNGNDQADD